MKQTKSKAIQLLALKGMCKQMKDFSIVTDSCCDLPFEFIESKKIPFVSLTCNYRGNEYKDDFGRTLSSKKFFDDMRQGAMPKTSQANSEDFYKVFKSIASEGRDILYICVSSGLSGTINSANIAKNRIQQEFPGTNVHILDTVTASLGQGLIVMKAYDMKEKGAGYKEIINYLEKNIQRLNTYITVDDLHHLKRGGRISSTSAIIGIVLHIKPVLTLNYEGKVIPVLKIRGRKNVINKIAEIVKERIENPEDQIISICHGDCVHEAEKLKSLILENMKVKDVLINHIGPVVGTFGGPGALAVFFMGKERPQHSIEIEK